MSRKRLGVVLDTNTLVSALILPHSVPAQALTRAAHECDVFTSDSTFDELAQVLMRPKFDRYFTPGDTARENYLAIFRELAIPVQVTQVVTACTDPKDNQFLELALSASAQLLVTGDKKHLLSMDGFGGLRILTASEFLQEPLD